MNAEETDRCRLATSLAIGQRITFELPEHPMWPSVRHVDSAVVRATRKRQRQARRAGRQGR